MQVVLVIGVGRSGTTLMQRVLNTMPETNVCGENRHAWLHVARFAQALLRLPAHTRAEYEQGQSHFWYAWYNTADKAEVVAALRQLFLTMYCPTGGRWKRVGFKEIRMGQHGYAELEAELEFFRLLFPDVVIIFNLREPQAILNSQAQQQGEYGDPRAQALFKQYAATHDNCLVWHYEDWHRPEKVELIFNRVGEPFTPAYQQALLQKT